MKKILYSEQCGNGIEISVIDQSRKTAGDRWLVKISCTVECPVPAQPSGDKFPEGAGGVAESKEKVSKVFYRERNFIEEGDRQGVAADLLQQLKTTVFPYLRKEATVQKLLAADGGLRQEPAGGSDAANRFSHLDRDEGPADFSSLFSDK